jgi:hypothetical protein
MGVIGVISALLKGLMIVTVTTSDDSDLTARLLALRQLPSVTPSVQQHTTSSQKKPASTPPPSASTSTIADEQAKKLTCTVRQLDMRAGCGKICT